MKLFATNVDVAVYDTLIDTVNANIPRLTRYLRLRKKLLKLKELHWYDLYVPMVGEVDYKIDYRQAQQTVLAALAPLGREYVDALADGFARRWVDVVESQNKASGAYSSGSFLTPPFMLLNWQDSLESTFTLAHEAGHSMHSFFSRRGQPYHLADYTIFVAEVASTCNEALLAHYLLASKEC
jgi:oligoendopeptidase F